MEPDTTVQNLYIARAGVNDTITGMGRFNGTMAFYTSRSFTYMVRVMKTAALFVHLCNDYPPPPPRQQKKSRTKVKHVIHIYVTTH
jgi:hypothetical protein